MPCHVFVNEKSAIAAVTIEAIKTHKLMAPKIILLFFI